MTDLHPHIGDKIRELSREGRCHLCEGGRQERRAGEAKGPGASHLRAHKGAGSRAGRSEAISSQPAANRALAGENRTLRFRFITSRR